MFDYTKAKAGIELPAKSAMRGRSRLGGMTYDADWKGLEPSTFRVTGGRY